MPSSSILSASLNQNGMSNASCLNSNGSRSGLINDTDRSQIIITSRRRPTQVFWQDHRIRFIALDFLRPLEELIEAMRPFCHHVTHAFFASYVHCADFSKLRDSNVPLFENFLKSIDYVAGNSLQRVILHTGGKVRTVSSSPIINFKHQFSKFSMLMVETIPAQWGPSRSCRGTHTRRHAKIRRPRGELLLPPRRFPVRTSFKTQLGLERHPSQCHHRIHTCWKRHVSGVNAGYLYTLLPRIG